MGPGAAGDKALTWIQVVQGIFGGGPAAGFAAVFMVAFFALLGFHLWTVRKMNAAHLKTAMEVMAAVQALSIVQEAEDERRERSLARSQSRLHKEAPDAKPKGP